jgi:outer membrane protein OmpA-like peptidoglycan-associated protein
MQKGARTMQKMSAILSIGFWIGLFVAGAAAAGDLQVLIPEKSARISYQSLDNRRLMVSVTDPEGNPIRDLQPSDFVVGSGIRKADILKAEPFETSEAVPLNIVLVVDNSFSMMDRLAVKPLLTALDAFFDTVRPIDNVQAVVFKGGDPIAIKHRGLHVQTFQSSSPNELKAFFRQAYDKGITGKTYLHEAILAGLDLIQKMPAGEQKFLIIFSDGEDLNSDYDSDEIELEAFGIENFDVYCVDYMPKPEADPFLSTFSKEHGGRLWKATSASEILPIFEQFTSTLMYRYIITYELPHPLVLRPNELNLDVLTTTGGEPITNRIYFQTGSSAIPQKYVQFPAKFQADAFDERQILPSMDRYFNLLNIAGQRLRQNPAARIQISGGASDAAAEKATPELAEQRAQAVRKYLSDTWGIEDHRMEINTDAGSIPEAARTAPGAKAEQQYAEIIYTAADLQRRVADEFVGETDQVRQLHLQTHIFSGAGTTDWELSIFADEEKLHALSGSGDILPGYTLPLQDLGIGRIAEASALEARLQLKTGKGDVQEASSDLCHIRLARRVLIHELALPPGGMLKLEPETMNIEELTMIDSSPLLNYIFFETGQSEIPERYVRFSSRAETDSFDPAALKGTMEKYYHVLNIIGKRLRGNPEATIRLVGCNSNRGEERGRKDLSRSRAEAIKAYLHYVWGIETSRLAVEARNLPQVASNNRVAEGRAENQRVEIYSDSGPVLDTVKSTYVVAVSDAAHLRIIPEIVASYDLTRWQLQLTGDDRVLETLTGSGDLAPVYTLALEDIGLLKMGAFHKIVAKLEVEDRQGQTFSAAAASGVRFIRRKERVAQKEEYRVMEKYALILFDFDRTDIKARNQEIVDRIIARIGDIPSPTVRIVGHTDTIGKEAYNVSLSERRAQAAYRQMRTSGIKEDLDIAHEGAGPFQPMYDNDLPEGRALNRTVTVTIAYDQKDN